MIFLLGSTQLSTFECAFDHLDMFTKLKANFIQLYCFAHEPISSLIGRPIMPFLSRRLFVIEFAIHTSIRLQIFNMIKYLAPYKLNHLHT